MNADLYPLQMLLLTFSGWVNRQQQDVIEYLVEENRVLKEQLAGRRLRLNDEQRRRLAAKGKRLGRRILKDQGIEPAPQRPTSWSTFLRSHWGAIVAADFFTTEVWTPSGLTTYYVLFLIDLKSRRVHFAGMTPTRSVRKLGRVLTAATMEVRLAYN